MATPSTMVEGAFIAALHFMKKAREVIDESVPSNVAEKLSQAMLEGGAKKDVIEEHFYSLQHSVKTIDEHMERLIKEMGAAQHIIAAAVHKTPGARSTGPRRHLVL